MSGPALTETELDELRMLQQEYRLSALGDRPQSIAAAKLQRLLELEGKAMSIFTDWKFETQRAGGNE